MCAYANATVRRLEQNTDKQEPTIDPHNDAFWPETLELHEDSSGGKNKRQMQEALTLVLALRGSPSPVCALHLREGGACGSVYLAGGTVPVPESPHCR